MIDVTIVTPDIIFAALTGAIIWNLITWYFGLPSSSSHALLGGFAGSAIVAAGFDAIIPSGWTKTILFIVLVADDRHVRRLGVHGRDVLDLPECYAAPSRQALPHTSARKLGALLVFARRQRRAKDNGHRRHAPVLLGVPHSRRKPAGCISCTCRRPITFRIGWKSWRLRRLRWGLYPAGGASFTRWERALRSCVQSAGSALKPAARWPFSLLRSLESRSARHTL